MKVTKLVAEKVHGYLPIEVDFLPDLTFLIGLNGAGKTTALRLLMALLTPNLEDFSRIMFGTAAATVTDNGDDVIIRATRTPDSLQLSTTAVSEPLTLSSADLQILSEAARRPEEVRTPVHEKVFQHPAFRSITQMSTPMFLGLDRRFYSPTAPWEDSTEARRREILMRRHLVEDPWIRGPSGGVVGLGDVNFLVASTMSEIRAEQEQLDERLRNQILTGAFKYKPSDAFQLDRLPSRQELDRYRDRQAHIERAAEGLRLPVPDVKAALAEFFERMNVVVNALERTQGHGKKKKGEMSREFADWIINKPQVDRLFEHMRLLDQYGSERAKLREPIDRFLSLVNGFLTQTQKRVQVMDRGDLVVTLTHHESTPRPITALSSGERQLVVMLSHLSLNKNLAGSGVFIVDEPELSLHLGWQERFVDAIREANPNVQLIMATHSPAIILDRVDNCRSLSERSVPDATLA